MGEEEERLVVAADVLHEPVELLAARLVSPAPGPAGTAEVVGVDGEAVGGEMAAEAGVRVGAIAGAAVEEDDDRARLAGAYPGLRPQRWPFLDGADRITVGAGTERLPGGPGRKAAPTGEECGDKQPWAHVAPQSKVRAQRLQPHLARTYPAIGRVAITTQCARRT